MILETIFLWSGGLLLISVVITGLVFLWSWLFDKLFYNVRFSIKAIFYDLVYNGINKMPKDMELKLGTEWHMRYKDKVYTYKIIKEEKRIGYP
jgi:hypothetical protein